MTHDNPTTPAAAEESDCGPAGAAAFLPAPRPRSSPQHYSPPAAATPAPPRPRTD